MALISADRVKGTTTITGTGPFVMSTTVPARFRPFSEVCSVGDSFYYIAEHQTADEWEMGVGTYSNDNEITRTTVLLSTNGNTAVDFSSGAKVVFITLPAAIFGGGVVPVQFGGTGASTPAGARAGLGLEIGVNVQEYDADLAAIAALYSAANKIPYFTGPQTATLTDLTAFGRSLIDDADAAAGRTTLGLGSAAVLDATAFGASLIDDADASAARTTLDAAQSTWTQTGTGAVARTVHDKLGEQISVEDFGSANDAASFTAAVANPEASNRVISVNYADDDTALPTDYSDRAFEFNGQRVVRLNHTSSTQGKAKKVLKTQFSTSPLGELRSAYHIEAQSFGSGQNGPSSAHYGQTIAIHKKGYAGDDDPPAGEIDGLYIFIRQDGPKGEPSAGPNSSDATGILVNIQNVEDVGFTSAWEATTSNYDRTSDAVTRSIQTHIGAIDTNQVGAPSYGYSTVATKGANNYAYYAGIDSDAGASWTHILYAPSSVTIDASGNYRAPNSYWSGGAWSIVRSAAENGSTQITHRGTGGLFLFAQDAGVIQFGTNGAVRQEFDTSGNLRPATNLGASFGTVSRRAQRTCVGEVDIGSTSSDGVKILTGAGSPEGVKTASIGSLYLRNDGGAGSSLYVKESGTGNTGWVAK